MTATDPNTWAGYVLRATVASWHTLNGVVTRDPVHIWLEFEGLGWVQLHTPGDGSLAVTLEEPSEAYGMAQLGSVEVRDPAPEVLTSLVGRRVDDVAGLWQEPPGHAVGWVVFAGDTAIGIANLSDELTAVAWPSRVWQAAKVSIR